MIERIKEHPIVATGVAIAVGAGAIYGAVHIRSENTAQTDPTELTIPDGELNQYCDGPAWNLDQYQTQIESAASVDVASIDGSDTDAMKRDVATSVKPNNFAIAYMNTLIDYQAQPVNFADINGTALTKLSAMQTDGNVRKDTCKAVVSKVLTTGQHVEINSSAYLEVVPVYNEAKELTSGNLVDVEPNATSVKGFWVKTEQGDLPVVLTADGRLLISKTVGSESTVTTVVPGQEPNNGGGTGIQEGENPEANPGPLQEARPGDDNTPNAGPTTPARPNGPTTVVTSTPPSMPPITVTIPTPTTQPPTPTTKPPTPTTQPPTTPTTGPKTPPSTQPPAPY